MKNKIWLACIAFLVLINIIWFWPGKLYFLNDDLLHIPLTDQGYLFQTNSVRPVHELLIKLELFLYGKRAFGYHLTALFLHLVVAVQLFDLCLLLQKNWLKIESRQAMQAALLAVGLLLVYPQSSESLGWILGRAPVLSAVFLMITVRIFFINNQSLPIYFAGAFFFAIALFAYEQSIFVPVVLTLIAYLNKEQTRRKQQLLYAFILGLVGVGYIIVRKLVTSEIIGVYEGGNLLRLNGAALVANFFRILFRLIINPAPKTIFIECAFILVLVISSIMFFARKVRFNRKALIFFSGMILILIIPVISLGLAVNSFESGRYLYLPSIFFIAGISVAAVSVFYQNSRFKSPLIFLLIFLSCYWLEGKYRASKYYADASSYSKFIETKVQRHFTVSSDTLYLDTLHVTIHRLPVFRRGFKTGINWLNSNVDTNKIVVRYYHDEVIPRQLQ